MNKYKKILGKIIDLIIIFAILGVIIYVGYNLVSEKQIVNKTVTESMLTQDERIHQFMEIISEKIYDAFVEQDAKKVDAIMGMYVKKNAAQISEIANQIKIDSEKVDAKTLEMYKLNENTYKITSIYKEKGDHSYEMNGKKNTFVIKLNRGTGTFKVLDMKVGV